MSLPQLEQSPVSEVHEAVSSGAVIAAVGSQHRTRRSVGERIALGVCLGWLAVVVIGAIGASWLPVENPNTIDPLHRLEAPTGFHPFGADHLGRDILSRIVFGARVSIVVALVSFAIGIVIGGTAGVAAGYLRGRTEGVIMWLTDVVLSFPALVLLIALVAYTGRSLANISVVLGFLAIPVYTRLTRAHTLSVASEEFVLAAKAGGAGRLRILWREITPNVLPSILAYGFIAMSLTIVVEGTLSFLGLSVSEPTASWGGLIADGQHYLKEAPFMVTIPSAVLCLTVLALNLSGEMLRRRYESNGR
jgi:peptide/nickel transport system permease protein